MVLHRNILKRVSRIADIKNIPAWMEKQVQDLLHKVTRWAEAQPEILGLALVGSQARNEAQADSDIDFILLATEPHKFIDDSKWLKNFGSVKSHTLEDWGLVTSLRVFYHEGLEVEYGLTSREWASEPIDEGTRRVILNGMQILLDKTGLLTGALRAVRGHGYIE